MEFLKEHLGEELYNQVAEKLKGNDKVKLANLAAGEYVGKEKYAALEAGKKELETQLKERDTQLEELKKVDAAGLQAKIAELQEANTAAKAEYEAKLNQARLDHALDSFLRDQKVKNPKAVRGLLDLEKIKLDGDKLLGVEDQIKALRESDAYLFADRDPVPGAPNPAPDPAPKPEPKTAVDKVASKVSKLFG